MTALKLLPRKVLRKGWCPCTLALGLAVMFSVGTELQAQGVSIPILPPPAKPGRIPREFEAPPRPQAVPEEVAPAVPEQRPPVQAEKIRFTLKKLVLEGNTAYSEEDLRPFWANYLNKEVAVAQIFAIANRLTAKYRNDGYVLTQVIVPAQRIDAGVVHLQVVEGFVDKIRVEGNVRDRRGLIEAYTDKILRSRPLHAKDLERYLLLVNDLPGMTARAILSPSRAQPGASELTVSVTQNKSYVFGILLGSTF